RAEGGTGDRVQQRVAHVHAGAHGQRQYLLVELRDALASGGGGTSCRATAAKGCRNVHAGGQGRERERVEGAGGGDGLGVHGNSLPCERTVAGIILLPRGE